MASYAGAYGAGGASDALRQLLADRLTNEKFAEDKRRTKADEDAREKERGDTSEYRRQERVLQMSRDEANRSLNYEDRTERSRQFNARMQQDETNDEKRAKERADDREAGLEGEDRRRKYQVEDREDNQNFQSYMDSRRASREGGDRKQWLSRGGQVVYDAPRPGDLPQNSREQGRPVLSSDANKVTDIDVSLKDLETLGKNLPKGSTGLMPSLAASVPSWAAKGVESATAGMVPATTALEKQAMINRIRQVIGKGMEGGVLRKEDEAKYATMLPALGDSDELIKSKLDGLRQAMAQRREQQLENLGAAGYDVSRFSRQGGTALPPAGTKRLIDGQPAISDG